MGCRGRLFVDPFDPPADEHRAAALEAHLDHHPAVEAGADRLVEQPPQPLFGRPPHPRDMILRSVGRRINLLLLHARGRHLAFLDMNVMNMRLNNEIARQVIHFIIQHNQITLVA